MYYLQLLINGIVAGGVYALFALGLTMIYSIFRFINFAHGELIAWGAYGVYCCLPPLPFICPYGELLSLLCCWLLCLLNFRISWSSARSKTLSRLLCSLPP
ncbi:hypothetical protein JWH17_06515 [Desulfobulbus marinus]|nr:hypothetical protein [Desulfogranum marinum]